MLDWQGLLKFSLKYSDGTHKSQFKQMSEEDRKFLEEALQQHCNTQIKRLQNIIQSLEGLKFEEGEDAIDLLEEMQQLLDSLDKGEALYKLNGHIPLLKIIFYSKQNSNKNVALQILSSANQNDARVQNQSINIGALELTELIQKQKDLKVCQNMMGTISSIIRGENLQAKRIFIKIKGLELLKRLLNQKQSPRLKTKINTLFRDLLYYDDYLHQTYHDLSKFSNTAGLKIEAGHHDLTYDVNEQKFKNNLLPENKQYQGCIKKFLNDNKQIKQQYEIWLKQEESH